MDGVTEALMPLLLEDPAHLGLNPAAVRTLVDACEEQRQLAGLNSCQVALAREGRLGLLATLGNAASSSCYAVYSVTKPLMASAIWLLMAEQRIDIDAPVVSYFQEFGAHQKGAVAVAQLLTHTAGFPNAILGPPHWYERSDRVRCIEQWELAWAPGSRCQYHPTSSYWVLAEIIERIAQVDYREFVAQRINRPLGLEGFQLGVPEHELIDFSPVRSVGQQADAAQLQAFFGPEGGAPDNPDHKLLALMNDARVRALGVPGGGAVAGAGDVALFYQALLHNPGQLWDPAILADATGHIRVGLPDISSGLVANRSLGLIVQGDDGQGGRRGMGASGTSAHCFGHHGAGGQIAWADPASGLSFCFLTDSLDANAVRVAARGPGLSDLAAQTVDHGTVLG